MIEMQIRTNCTQLCGCSNTAFKLIRLGNSYSVSKSGKFELKVDGTTIFSHVTVKSLGIPIDTRMTIGLH
jgi:hypothetical protein